MIIRNKNKITKKEKEKRKEWISKMRKNKEKEVEKNKEQQKHDRGQTYVRIIAFLLAILMVGGTVTTLVFALMRY